MKIHVDYDRCEGHGLCAEQAPTLFSLDDAAELSFHGEDTDLSADEQVRARAAIASCPVAALTALP